MAGIPFDDQTLLKFWIGEVIHAAVQKLMSEDPEAGVLGHEVAVRDEEHQVSGRADTLTRTAEGLEVPEYKTIDARAFRYGDLPYASHILQDGTYMTFPTEFGLADRGRIVYIGLPGGRIEEYTVEATPELREFIKSEYLRLSALYAKYKETGELPPPLDAPKTDFRFKYCEYRGLGCCGDEKWPAKTDATSTSTTPSTESDSPAPSLAA